MSASTMNVSELTQPWAASRRLGADGPVTAVTGDSRLVVPGALFVAVPGFTVDGHRFLPEAWQRGAVAVVYQDPAAASLVPPPVT